MTNSRVLIEIAIILRKIGSIKCIRKADSLERKSISISTLNLKDLELTPSIVSSIASCLKDENANITSISFSYNQLIGDEGAIVLMNHLPQSITELGLVGCSITDTGGLAILDWMNKAPNLRMICIEQNNYSDSLRSKFKAFRKSNPHMIFVY